MKIQCDVCERAHTTVICCVDEAALCSKCDVEVHAANCLASKHQRLLLQSLSGKLPPCDICQEKAAFIFCVEDRALFCQDCDKPIHSAGSLSANHQRFLATGISVALCSKNPTKVVVEHRSGHPPPPTQKAQPVPKTEKVSVSASHWGVDELLQLSDFDSSDKKEQIEFGELDWLADMGIFADQLPQEALAPAEVPQLPASQRQINYSSSRTTSKFGVSNKKRRIEFLANKDDEKHFTVPDLG